MPLRMIGGLALIAVLASGCTRAAERTTTSSSRPPQSPTVLGLADPRGDAGVPETMGYVDALSADVLERGARLNSRSRLLKRCPRRSTFRPGGTHSCGRSA
jgi:hypothetical protein